MSEAAATDEVALYVEVARYSVAPVFLNVHESLEPSPRESCGPVELDEVSFQFGVVVPIPTLPEPVTMKCVAVLEPMSSEGVPVRVLGSIERRPHGVEVLNPMLDEKTARPSTVSAGVLDAAVEVALWPIRKPVRTNISSACVYPESETVRYGKSWLLPMWRSGEENW